MRWLRSLFGKLQEAEREMDLHDVPGAGVASAANKPTSVVFIRVEGERMAIARADRTHTICVEGVAYHHTHDDEGEWAYTRTR